MTKISVNTRIFSVIMGADGTTRLYEQMNTLMQAGITGTQQSSGEGPADRRTVNRGFQTDVQKYISQ